LGDLNRKGVKRSLKKIFVFDHDKIYMRPVLRELLDRIPSINVTPHRQI